MFVHNNFGGRLGAIELTDVERELLVMVNRELKAYINNLEHIKCVGLLCLVLCHLLLIILAPEGECEGNGFCSVCL